MKTIYCLGFAFNRSQFAEQERVLLIRKNRPDWQKGKLNGIGGHVEPGEFPVDAMTREFREECGLDVPANDWTRVCNLVYPDAGVHVFSVQLCSRVIDSYKSLTDEKVRLFWVKELFPNVDQLVPNLPWLVPMAFAALKPGWTHLEITE